MQQRFHITYHPDYDAALAAKKEIETKQPNDNFQIRKRATNFELVGRVSATAAKAYIEDQQGYTKKKKKPKKLWKKSLNAQPFNYDYNNEKSRENGTGKWTDRKVDILSNR